MDFYKVVDQVVDLLQSRKRVAYRALKRQFNFDDDDIEALKDELIDAQGVAIDEGGKVLVWTGNAPPIAEPTVTQPEATPSADSEPSRSHLTTPTPDTSDLRAERRQLTVMFCDLVDSMALSGQLDPEDLRNIIRSYQSACTEIIERYDGHVAQLLGDGLLVYFGFPLAHEDDAQRAIYAGLGILEAIGTLNEPLKQDHGIRLAVRLGIHTGLVVVGEMGGEGRQEQLALGETPNVAARIQGLADPDTIIMSGATSQLVQGYFHCEDLGKQNLRGVAQPINVYRVLQESGAQSRLDVASTKGLTPLVGRESEVTLLLDRWQQIESGLGQVVLLSGEAGIGKSRMVRVLKEHVATTSHIRLECRSSPYYQNTALYPITDLIQRTLQWEPDDDTEGKLRKLEQVLGRYQPALEETVPLFATLLSLPLPEDRYAPLNLTPQRQRQKTLETLVAMFVEESERQPVLFIVEDLHWTDPTTLEFLERLIDQNAKASIFILLTCRPEFEPTWSHRTHLAELSLSRLSQAQIEQMIEQVTNGKHLPDEVIRELIEKTDGVPLYLEEMTKAIVESGNLEAYDDHYELTGSIASLTIPATLHDSLMARLDRLESAKGLAQLGAVIGRTFSYHLLKALTSLDTPVLQLELQCLVEAELVFQRGAPPQAIYTFKHALIQDAAYQSLLRRTRQDYHQQIAEVLEQLFPMIVENQPELLAHHYTEAAHLDIAIGYWYTAGQQAIAHSANREAAGHFNHGLALLKQLPEKLENLNRELNFQIGLSHVIGDLVGWANPELGPIYQRAYSLCRNVGNTTQLRTVLTGMGIYYTVGGNFPAGRQVAEELLQLASRENDPMAMVGAHLRLGDISSRLGEHPQALEHFEQGIALYRAQSHLLETDSLANPGIMCLITSILDFWVLGYPDQATQRGKSALELADRLSSARERSVVLFYLNRLSLCQRDWQETLRLADETIAFSAERDITQSLIFSNIFRGRALTAEGQHEQGLSLIQQGLEAYRTSGAISRLTHLLAILAESQAHAGQLQMARASLEEALTLAEGSGEPWIKAELYRLKGEFLLNADEGWGAEVVASESCFKNAINIARNQQAKSWELRAATSLAQLWLSQGRHQDAYDLLAPIYDWFTEGFDTSDLIDAKALLDELTEASS